MVTRLGGASGLGTGADAAGASAGLASARNGELTIMDSEPDARGTFPVGWYGFSSIDPDGRLRPVVRCPNHAEWCGEVQSIDWSPDGRHIALSVTSFGLANRYNGIHVVDLGSGRDRQLRSCGPPECDWFDLDWSPDGRTVAYVTRGAIHLLRPSTPGAAPTVLARGDRPSWSADGKWIAFARPGPGGRSLHVIAADGSHQHLLERAGSAPAWSPDGRRILYRQGCRFLMTTPAGVDVTPPRLRRCLDLDPPRLPRAMQIGPAVWSPDGTMIAFSSGLAGTFVMNADGTGVRRLTHRSLGCHCGQQARPAWRPLP